MTLPALVSHTAIMRLSQHVHTLPDITLCAVVTLSNSPSRGIDLLSVIPGSEWTV